MTLFIIVFPIVIIIITIFIFRRSSSKILDSTKYSYLRYSGIDGQAKILNLTDTGKTLANVYTIMDAEIEITSLNPSVKTKTQVAFLKSKIPELGSMVNVKYDSQNPKIAMILV